MSESNYGVIVRAVTGRRRLAELVPETDNLLADPQATLKRAEIRIGAVSLYRIATGTALSSVLLALCYLVFLQKDGIEKWVFLGSSVFIAMATFVYVVKALFLPVHELFIRADGVEFKRGHCSVWCPWALFNVNGSPFIQDTQSLWVKVHVPVATSAIPFVKLRKDDRCIVQGINVNAAQFCFRGTKHVVLYRWYALFPDELGQLLLSLGQQLGSELPTDSAPREAYPPDAELRPDAHVPGKLGWLEVDLTRIKFPPLCCDCCGAVDHMPEFSFGLFPPLVLKLPLCSSCQDRYHLRELKAVLVGAALAAPLGIPAALILMEAMEFALWVLLTACSLFACIGGIVGHLIAARQFFPLKLSAGESPAVVYVRFRRPEYAQLFLDAQNEHEASPEVD